MRYKIGPRWIPECTERVYGRPDEGDLLAIRQGVWRVVAVSDLERALWSDEDEEYAARATRDSWSPPVPYRVELDWVAGHNPLGRDSRGEPRTRGALTMHSWSHAAWHRYRGGRWPMCSCCGEPMPCPLTEQIRIAAEEMDDVEALMSKMPGCCWGCGEPITARQKSVVFAGENVDLPGGPEVRFHTRRACQYSARNYELRWLDADPSRPRILTWPHCPGRLIVHHDGSSECHGGLDECAGHLTHDHSAICACYAQSLGCPRECPIEGHPGTRYAPRPQRNVRVHTDSSARG